MCAAFVKCSAVTRAHKKVRFLEPSHRTAELRDELAAYPAPAEAADLSASALEHDVFTPLLLRGPGGEVLNFFSTVAIFGTAVDITVAELSIESFFPADDATAAACRAFAPR